MTLIECFVNSPLENIATALCLKPKKIIFIGNAKNTNLIIDKYRKVLKDIEPDIVFKKTASGSFLSAEKKIKEVLCTEKDCVLDITGGQETVLMAAGALYSEFKNTNPFKILRFDADSSLMVDAVTGRKGIGTKASLSVDDLIFLHGGCISSCTADNLSAQDKRDLETLWQTLRSNYENWNKTISFLHEFENKSDPKSTSDRFSFDLKDLSGKIKNFDEKLELIEPLLKEFANKGLLTNYFSNNNIIRYMYKNAFVQNCLKKEGNLLEFKTYCTALDLKDETGAKFFDDCRMSVTIDWDGTIHRRNEPIKDTSNEIDVILMRGCKAFFISCKNGSIEEDELYKLSTVALSFGGKYVSKALLSTHFKQDDDSSKEAYRQRAKDMKVSLGEEAVKFSTLDWEIFLKDISFF